MPNVVGAPHLPVPGNVLTCPRPPAQECPAAFTDWFPGLSGELACSGAAMAGGALLLASLAAAQAYGS